MPFKIGSVENIIFNQIDELLDLLEEQVEDEQVEDEDEYNVFPSVEVEVTAREPDKEYEENKYFWILRDFIKEVDVDKECMEDSLDIIIQKLEEETKEEQQEYNIIGIQTFHSF